jgi:hypothetical protein
MIIKRWVEGTGFVKEFPQTKAGLIRNASDTDDVFDGEDKIKALYLPNSVFDSLYFFSTVSTNTNIGSLATDALKDALNVLARSALGYYWVASAAVELTSTLNAVTRNLYSQVCTINNTTTVTTSDTAVLRVGMIISGTGITANTTIASITNSTTFVMSVAATGSGTPSLNFGYSITTTFNRGEESQLGGGSSLGTVNLESGDWVVLTKLTGVGSIASPYLINFSTVNNTYENASTTVDGIVRLSSQTAYASLSGNNVVTDGRLKTLIDNAAFAAGSHGHGSILTGGTITAAVVAPANTDTILISDTSASGLVSRGITIGTSTTTFLTEAGTWATPTGTYSHPTQTARAIDTTGVDVLDVFASNTDGHVTNITTRTLPNATTSAPGVMSAADKTKLDGVATGATANTGTVTSVATSGTVSGITLTGGTITTSGTVTLGGTLAVLPSNFASQSANFALIAPNGAAGTPTFRALVAADIPTLNQNTTGNAANVTGVVAILNGGTGATTKAGGFDALSPMNASGDIIYGGASGTGTRLGKGTDGQVLKLVSGFPAWGTDNNTVATATALGGLTETSNAFRMAHPLFVQLTTPGTPLTGTVWFDIN